MNENEQVDAVFSEQRIESIRTDKLSKGLTVYEANLANNTNMTASSLKRCKEYIDIINKIYNIFCQFKCMSTEDYIAEGITFDESSTVDDMIYMFHYDSLKNCKKMDGIKFIDRKNFSTIMGTIGRRLTETNNKFIGLFGTNIYMNDPILVVRVDGDENAVRKYLFDNKNKIITAYEATLESVMDDYKND